MNKNRLENLSDGVFSIAVTLLILNVKIPETTHLDNHQLKSLLFRAAPHLASFAFSFMVIGVFWVSHHRIFSFVTVANSTLLWLNIVYLLFVAIVPLSASIVSDNPFLPASVALYCITLSIIAIMQFIMIEYVLKNRHLKHEALTRSVYITAQRTALVGPVCYLTATAACFISVYISYVFVVGSILFYILFSGKGLVEEKLISAAKEDTRAD